MGRGRQKLFKNGKRPVNISNDIFEVLESHANDENLYVSQVLDKILRKWIQDLENKD